MEGFQRPLFLPKQSNGRVNRCPTTVYDGGSIQTFRLQLFGVPSLRDESGLTPPGLGWGKPLALLALLAIRREIRRDEVVDLLWRGVEEHKARNAFRQALHRLRGAVGDDVLPQDRERLRLVPADRLSIDLDRFEANVAAGRLTAALEDCAGDFLETTTLGEPPFDMWVEQERARFRTRIARVLTDAAAAAAAEGRWAEAVSRTHRLMDVAPYETASAHLAATTLISAGRRHEAREFLKKFAATLDAELGLPLPPELLALLTRLERQPAANEDTSAHAKSPGRDRQLPFVGREGELSQLVTLCRTTAEELGGFALVKGDAGTGKSRLLAELIANMKSLGRVTVLQGREHVAGIQLPYAVFAEALRPLVRAPGVVGASRHLLAEAARLLPDLRDEIDLPAVSDVEDEAGRLRFFEGIAAFVDAAAFERPIVLVVDDVHLAGPSTLELLSYLCARLSRSAVTFVFALRPAEAPASMLARLEAIAKPDSQTHAGRALALDLKDIDAESARAAVAVALKGMGVGSSTLEQVVVRGDGVPARLTDLVRRVLRGEPVTSAPVTIREIIVDRVATLTSVQRRLLFVIALIGRPTSRSEAGAAAHLPDAAVGEALDTLIAEALVEVNERGFIEIGDAALRTALDLAGPSTRAFLSGWIADELSAQSAAPADLARFYSAAGQPKAAFEQSRLAAFAALAVGAVPEATHHLQNARTFAQSPADLAAIESLLTAVGAGKRQIPTEKAKVPPSQAAETPYAPERTGRIETLFPNWRLLLGAAVATLTISAVVLADRSIATPGVSALGNQDTLLVSEDDDGRVIRFVTGNLRDGFVAARQRTTLQRSPAWIDSLRRPGERPLVAPRGQRVAVERTTPAGSDLVIVSADRRDTIPILVGMGDARALGWSPDGRWLLASLARGAGSFDAELLAFGDDAGRLVRRPIDTTPGRSVMEAAWSPDGARIAWVARVGAERQLEVFVSRADGSNARNVSRHPADDQHIAWAPSGDLLAFTSTRDGNAELYAASFLESRLWRLTFDPAQDDAPSFSNDGRLIAFESTRGGAAGVFVMPALGGDARLIESRVPLTVVRWAGQEPRYVDRVLIEQSPASQGGDTVVLRLTALDQFDESLSPQAVEWLVLDSAIAHAATSAGNDMRLVGRRPGLVRVAGTVGRWRHDTTFVRIGDQPVPLLESESSVLRRWRAIGAPVPIASGDQRILLRSDREWDSGILSRSTVPLLPGFVFESALELPLRGARDPATTVSVALVAPEDSSTIDPAAPQFLRYASFSWSADARRYAYAVGREVFTEPAGDSGQALLNLRLRVERDSTVSFAVDGRERWRSTLRVLGRQGSRAHIWISGRATGSDVHVGGVRAFLGLPETASTR